MLKLVAILTALVVSGLPLQAQDAAEGKELFLDYCATCHGREGEGNGPMAPAMSLQPTNLTLLMTGNDGVFPTLRVVMRIDGREPLVSHGSPMPVFGDFFEGSDRALKAESGQPILTSQPVVDLVVWLETIQK